MRSGYANNLVPDLRPMRTLGMLLLGFLLAGGMAGVAGTLQSEESGTRSAGTLEAALTGMDRAAARFTGVTADLDYTKVTVIVDDHSTDRGTVAFAKKNGEARVMLAFQEPAERFVLFEGNKVIRVEPGPKDSLGKVVSYAVWVREQPGS